MIFLKIFYSLCHYVKQKRVSLSLVFLKEFKKKQLSIVLMFAHIFGLK
jgi:hypothetical protein